MRHVLLALTLALCGCDSGDDEPTGIPLCTDCDNDAACPATQPGINPLQTCDTAQAVCFYCSTVMRSFVCEGGGDTDGDLRWRDNGVPDMCPAPSAESSGSG